MARTAFTLDYAPPYDWDAMLGFLGTRAIPGIESCDSRRYVRTFELDGCRGVVEVANDARARVLRVDVRADGPVPIPSFTVRLRAMFDLDAEPARIRAALCSDARAAALVDAAPGLRVPGGCDPFEILVRAILGQQVTVAAGRTFVSRLAQHWGSPIEDGILFPTPAALAEAEIEAIGVTGRRADTIRSLSRAVADGVIPLDPGTDFAVVRDRLLGIAGIGEWTVGYAQLRAFKDPDAFPAGDVALLRAAQRLGIAETAKALAAAAEDWRPRRAYMVMHLWRAGSGGGV